MSTKTWTEATTQNKAVSDDLSKAMATSYKSTTTTVLMDIFLTKCQCS